MIVGHLLGCPEDDVCSMDPFIEDVAGIFGEGTCEPQTQSFEVTAEQVDTCFLLFVSKRQAAPDIAWRPMS